MDLIRFTTSQGSHVLVEAPAGGGFTDAGAGDRIREALVAFEAGLKEIAEAADGALAALQAGAARFASIEMEFGVRFSAESGFVVAKVAGEAMLSVKMTWTGGAST